MSTVAIDQSNQPYGTVLVLHRTERPLLPAAFAHCKTRRDLSLEVSHLIAELSHATEHDSEFFKALSDTVHALDRATRHLSIR